MNEQQNQRKFQAGEFDEKAIFLCQFCGGQSCDQQNYLKNKIEPNAIKGIHSNWITDNILAMQRPSQRLIKQYKLLEVFKEKGIRTVLNLQEAGEHPYCGDGIIPAIGFSYRPETFFSHGIHVFNQSWEDMTATTFEHMMKIMNIFQMSLSNGGKISVHCHAGRGRTLLVICSWLIYHQRMSAAQTIELAVRKRQGVLTRSSQRQFLHYFQVELRKRWSSFSLLSEHKSIGQLFEWQQISLLNKERKKLHHTPVVHSKIIHHLRQRLQGELVQLTHALITPTNGLQKWSENQEQRLDELKRQFNQIKFGHLHHQESLSVVVELLYDFYESLPMTILTSLTIDTLIEHCQQQKKRGIDNKLHILLQPSVVHSLGITAISILFDLTHLVKTLKHKLIQAQEKQEGNVAFQKSTTQSIGGLYTKFAILLLSKRKYFPQLFPSKRECKIIKHYSKLPKILNSHVIFLTNFMDNLSDLLPQSLHGVSKIIFDIKKVDANLYYITSQEQHKHYLGQKRQEVYEYAKIKHGH